MVESETISDLLRQAERAQEYDGQSEVVHLRFDQDTYVISDLHIGRGKGSGGCFSGTENFFYDEALARFLTSITPGEDEARRVLVINGDFIDFLRIVEVPASAADYG